MWHFLLSSFSEFPPPWPHLNYTCPFCCPSMSNLPYFCTCHFFCLTCSCPFFLFTYASNVLSSEKPVLAILFKSALQNQFLLQFTLTALNSCTCLIAFAYSLSHHYTISFMKTETSLLFTQHPQFRKDSKCSIQSCLLINELTRMTIRS